MVMANPSDLLALAARIDPVGARERRARLGDRATAVLLSTAYPAFAAALEADPAGAPLPEPLGRAELAAEEQRLAAIEAPDALRRELRRAAQRGRMRIALRELLPPSLG